MTGRQPHDLVFGQYALTKVANTGSTGRETSPSSLWFLLGCRSRPSGVNIHRFALTESGR